MPPSSGSRKRSPVFGGVPSSAGPPARRQYSAVWAPAATPRSARSIASARQASSPRRPKRSAREAQPATAPGTVTERGPSSLHRLERLGACGSGPGGIEARELSVLPDDRERIAADPGRHRLGDAENGGGGKRRVDGVPPAFERPEPGLCCGRLARRDHRLRGDGGRAARRESEAHRDASIAEVLTLYDAARCPYCARVRIVLAEKCESVRPGRDRPRRSARVDLREEPGGPRPGPRGGRRARPAGVPRHRGVPRGALSRAGAHADRCGGAGARAAAFRALQPSLARVLRRASRPQLRSRVCSKLLAELDADLEAKPYLGGSAYGLADIAYLPWILRAETRLGVDLGELPALAAWRDGLTARPAVSAELELVAALA